MTKTITIQELRDALPVHLQGSITQKIVDGINTITTGPEAAEQIRSNFISYTAGLRKGRFKAEDYAAAVVYVSFKIMGFTNQESYKRTFPERHAEYESRGSSEKDISAYVSHYHKTELVGLIVERTSVPVHVLKQDVFQRAINKQVDLMRNARSERVRCKAASWLLTHLKRPAMLQGKPGTAWA